MKIVRNRWMSKVLMVLLALGTSGVATINARSAGAQGRAANLAPQLIIDSTAPSLVRQAPLKSTSQAGTSVRFKIEEGLVARDRPVDIDFSVLQMVAINMATTGQPQRIRIPFFGVGREKQVVFR